MDGSEELSIASLEKAYKSRLSMLHDFLCQEPIQIRKPSAGKRGCDIRAATENREQGIITEIITRAKRLQKDIVEELTYHGVTIAEVAI